MGWKGNLKINRISDNNLKPEITHPLCPRSLCVKSISLQTLISVLTANHKVMNIEEMNIFKKR